MEWLALWTLNPAIRVQISVKPNRECQVVCYQFLKINDSYQVAGTTKYIYIGEIFSGFPLPAREFVFLIRRSINCFLTLFKTLFWKQLVQITFWCLNIVTQREQLAILINTFEDNKIRLKPRFCGWLIDFFID